MQIPRTLLRGLAANRASRSSGPASAFPFAAVCFPPGLNCCKRLADALAAEAKQDQADIVRLFVKTNRLDKAADEALDGLGAAGFVQVMRECFDMERPADVDLALVEQLWRLHPKLVVTTNYDDVLQWARSARE